MMRSIRPAYTLLLFFSVPLGLYCISLINITLKPAVINIDDRDMMQFLFNHQLTLRELFTPNSGKYFRPLLGITFLTDQRVWEQLIFGYRFTNVLLHACNTLLVYMLGMLLFKNDDHRDGISAGSALLFSVHPIAVESVSWISGRTDPLVTFWTLLSFYTYLMVTKRNALFTFPFCLSFVLAAALSKETGISALILIIVWELYFRKNMSYRETPYAPIFVMLLALGAVAYVALRINALATRDMSVELIKTNIFSLGTTEITLFLSSFGFYAKKFIFPFPLQFAIDSIHVVPYVVLGILIILLFFALVLKRSSPPEFQFFYFWFILGLFLPAVISLTDIAWTRWAERYLYFSLVPLSFMTLTFFFKLKANASVPVQKIYRILFVLVIAIFAIFSVQRSLYWNDNLVLARDTLKKAPLFIPAAVQCALALKDKGMNAEAEQQLHAAELMAGAKHQVFYQLGLLSMGKGNREQAKQYFIEALAEARNDKKLVLMATSVKKAILTSLSTLEMTESELHGKKSERTRYGHAIEYLLEAYKEDPSDFFILYNIAKLYLSTGNNHEAIKYFEEFIKKWDNNDVYRQTAERLLKKLVFDNPAT